LNYAKHCSTFSTVNPPQAADSNGMFMLAAVRGMLGNLTICIFFQQNQTCFFLMSIYSF